MYVVDERVEERLRKSEELFAAFKHQTSYQRVELKDPAVVEYTNNAQMIIANIPTMQDCKLVPEAIAILDELIDDLRLQSARYPVPFLDY